MDWTSLILAMGIALYGVLEYRRREVVQKQRIEGLRRGVMPSFEPPAPRRWQLLTTVAVELSLLLFAVWIWSRAVVAGKYFGAYAPLGAFITILALIVLMMLVNLIGRYRQKV